jgi:predicted nucleic acid-binding protein
MTLVVDASAAIRWLFKLNGWERAESLFLSGDRLIAPDLVLVEMTNAAWKFVQFEKQPAELVAAILRHADKAFEELIPASGLAERAFEIALQLRHPVYDCFYLALAEARADRLVTADERLIRRCANTSFAPLIRPL